MSDKIFFYNLSFKKDFATDELEFHKIIDDKNGEELLKKYSLITYEANIKGNNPYHNKGVLVKGSSKINDYCLLLTLVDFKFTFTDYEEFSRSYQAGDFALILSDEIEDYITTSLINLERLDQELVTIFRNSLLLYIYAQYFTRYSDINDILFMNCFEFLIKSLLCYKKKINPNINNVDFSNAFKFIINEYKYNEFVEKRLIKEMGLQKFQKMRSGQKIKLSLFNNQFREMRNWINHGKYYSKPVFPNYPANLKFTFIYKLRNLIRVILLDIIYTKDYARKFDVLYQLVLENNVNIVLTPDISKK